MPMRVDRLDRPLESNGFVLDKAPNRLGDLEPSEASEPLEVLKRRYREHGYLWLRGFFDRETVLGFREHFFEQFRDSGLLAKGSRPADGIYSGQESKSVTHKILMEVVRSAAYESFCLQERLWRFYDAFLGGPSYLHKRKIVRYTRPNEIGATPAHYDLIYLRGGTDTVCSSWIPIGDTSIEMGGLVYLEGSDAAGRALEAEFAAKNAELPPEERISAYNKNMAEGGAVSKDLPAMAEQFDTRWLAADYEAGDMLVHSAYMIHAATSNQDRDGRLRLSTDIRYQNVREEIDARWSNHWGLDDML